MILFCLFFFAAFPVSALIPTSLSRGKDGLTADASAFFKGAAICFVVMSHISILLGLSERNKIFSAVDQFGGMGVLIFFFLSGFGLYKAYAGKTDYKRFVIKRTVNVIIPYLILKAVFIAAGCILRHSVSASGILARFDDWFVDIILIQYLIFLVCWRLLGRKKGLMTAVCLAVNLGLAVVFMNVFSNPRWYNALLLFPAGMAAALFEEKIRLLFTKQRILSFAACLILFAAFGALFVMNKDSIPGNLLKTCAGIMLGLLVYGLSLMFSFGSPVMKYIGRNSLYFYIIHLEIKKLLESCFTVSPLWSAVIIILGTAAAVPLVSFLHSKIFAKWGQMTWIR